MGFWSRRFFEAVEANDTGLFQGLWDRSKKFRVRLVGQVHGGSYVVDRSLYIGQKVPKKRPTCNEDEVFPLCFEVGKCDCLLSFAFGLVHGFSPLIGGQPFLIHSNNSCRE
jgi:hypothetical protein